MKKAFLPLVLSIHRSVIYSSSFAQPGDGRTIYKEFLEKNGEGVIHIGFEVEILMLWISNLQGMG